MAKRSVLLPDYCLTTAHILYHLPDHPGLLQSYLWQDYDIAPDYPVLVRFLDFWTRNLEGRLHSVTVGKHLAEARTALRRCRARALSPLKSRTERPPH